jgi:transposase
MLVDRVEALAVDIEPRSNSRPVCLECGKRRNVYDRQQQRLFEYLPIWTFKSYYRYAPRRVNCPTCGVKVEALP